MIMQYFYNIGRIRVLLPDNIKYTIFIALPNSLINNNDMAILDQIPPSATILEKFECKSAFSIASAKMNKDSFSTPNLLHTCSNIADLLSNFSPCWQNKMAEEHYLLLVYVCETARGSR